ncbi:toll/interleukin-1 receptor domain-containing protein [Sorangium sp. So ce233]|uniref:toll/interleukin-1 receptor domain-containing protein n=1 Tax=Sorangium sp. So ce233 TaxID=3133290 RepID=UPI003F5D8196
MCDTHGTVYTVPVPGQDHRIEVFLSCASEDEALLAKLEKHLSTLRNEGLIQSFHTGNVGAGQVSKAIAEAHLERADMVLLLVSSDFLATRECYERDVARAIARHEARHARVVPVLLRDCDWRHTVFGALRALPKNGRPVKSWEDEDEAFADVARGIREAVTAIAGARSPALLRHARRREQGEVTRTDKVRETMQSLGKPDCVGVALLAPFGFEVHQVAGEVLHQLQRPGEALLPVRLVPEAKAANEEWFYGRLLRDLRWALPEPWRKLVDARAEASAMDRFEYAVEDLLDGPVAEAGRKLLFVVDGLAQVPAPQIERWGYLMARLSSRGLKLLVWGGQELHELRTRPASGGRYSAFHVLSAVSLGALSAREVHDLVTERGGDAAAAEVLCGETGGHPALVRELVDGHVDDVRAADREALMARILASDHLVRLRRTVAGDAEAQEMLRALARAAERPLPRRRRGEERLAWLGVLKDAGATRWDWVAPAMQRFAAEWA